MEKLNNNDLKKINGGGVSATVGILIGAGIVFLIGLIDGYVRPLKCN